MASSDVISRLNSKLTSIMQDRETPDYLTRDIGGQFRRNNPYFSGYFQVWFGVPERLFRGPVGPTAVTWLHSTCENFTPHSVTPNSVDIPGIGGTGSSHISGVLTTREFSLSFREYQNLPVLNTIKLWTSVFDPHTGVSPLRGKEFNPTSYKGWCIVAQMKPTGGGDNAVISADDLEECYVYQGVWPKNIPIDTVGQTDISASDSIQLSVSFSFDGSPLTSSDDGVVDKVLTFFSAFKYTDTFEKYHSFVGT